MAERILLVEDDALLGGQVTGHLRDAGYETAWLRDGDEALAHDFRPYALVILDLMLPGAHGLDVLKRLRERAGTPVLVLSALKTTPDKVRALGLGADDYMTKPFWPEELLARVRARLRRPDLRRGCSSRGRSSSISRRAVSKRADVRST
jgi:DNA-binding response OmpR family regulator